MLVLTVALMMNNVFDKVRIMNPARCGVVGDYEPGAGVDRADMVYHSVF